MTHEEEQDLNRQVAEAEGCTPERRDGDTGGRWCCPHFRHDGYGGGTYDHGMPGGRVRDYLHDKAWLWDAEVKHQLDVYFTIQQQWLVWGGITGGITTRGATRAEAVCRWRVAAAKAGVKGEG
jgi:hypothetical protein